MRSVSDIEQLIVFQGAGYEIIRVRVLSSEEGILYIKGVVFPSFAFLHPLTSHTQLLFIPPYTLSSIMASYTEDILRAACEASGPSIRDFKSIKCFQSRPTTKDVVRFSFYSFF
jgi:hypothetical protein